MDRETIATQIDSIHLKNINLEGLTLMDELLKIDEESEEFKEALINYLYNRSPENRLHLIEETCDKFQVHMSLLKIIGIDIPEIVEYWNTEHLKKLELRPR